MALVIYSPGRAKQLRILLWSSVVVAAAFSGLAAWILIVGGVARFALFLAIPGLLLLASATRTLQLMEHRGTGARFGSIGTGIVLLLIGLVLANSALGIIPTILGILMVLLAVLPDVGDQG